MGLRYRPPGPGLLSSIANQRLDFRVALGEFIDNAIDAEATQVTITVGEQRRGQVESLRVQDNGHGCEDLADLVELAKHTRQRSTVLGRYGIGGKHAMLWLGGEASTVEIASTHRGVFRRLVLRWPDYGRGWGIDDDWLSTCPAPPEAIGTTIVVRPCIQRFPDGKALTGLLSDLGYLYSPALKRGVQIQLRVQRRGVMPILLQRWELPPLTEIVDQRFTVDGRGARVYAGIVSEGAPNPRPGLSYVHGFRVIKMSSGLGCGGLDHSKISGFVELDEKWQLTTNKDDLSQHRDELGAAVFEHLRMLLEHAAARGSELRLTAFHGEVEERLKAMLAAPPNEKGRRTRTGATPGTVSSTGTGSPHRRARKRQSGDRFPGPPSGGLRVGYVNLDDPERLGHYADDQVVLNTGHRFVHAAEAACNADLVATLACLVYVDGARAEAQEREAQRRLPFASTGDLVKDLGCLLALPGTLDGQALGNPMREAG